MKLSATKPISYVKSNTADLIKEVSDSREPIAISQNGYVKAVLVDVKSFEEQAESLAMLKLLAQSKQTVRIEGARTVRQGFKEVRRKANELRNAR